MSLSNQNITIADGLLEWMMAQGLEDLVLCPGARNAPFVFRSQNRNLNLYEHYDERSAAFFALGIAKRKRQPVAVVTTSGTAAAELLAATAEAYYSGVPLWVITADRPLRMRHSGAPQTMPQNNFFKDFVYKSWDITDASQLPTEVLNHQLSPIHFNLCFDEPLLTPLPQIAKLSPAINNFAKNYDLKLSQAFFSDSTSADYLFLQEKLTHAKNPLIWIGPVEPMWRASLSEWLQNIESPIVAEASSGMWPKLKDHPAWIKTGEPWIQWMQKSNPFDIVVRIGGVPTGRFWRDLETLKTPVINISALEFAGLSRENVWTLPWETGFEILSKIPKSLNEQWMQVDQNQQNQLGHLLETLPQSECAMIHRWSKNIKANDSLFVGNSLPIREWDLVGWITGHDLKDTWVNRGVNGIDGLISTFLGLAETKKQNWCLLGDLSALYDFSGLWATRSMPDVDINVVIVNNFGGQIFDRIFSNKSFLNTHDLNFEAMAKFWNMDYEKIEGDTLNQREKSVSQKNNKKMIELCPDYSQTQKFWNDWDLSWKNIR